MSAMYVGISMKCMQKLTKMGRTWGCILLKILMRYHITFYAVSQTKLQIINLNTVPTIICRGTNETDKGTDNYYLLNIWG